MIGPTRNARCLRLTEAANLTSLRAAMETADKAFDAACRQHYADGRWGYYWACEADPAKAPKACHDACDAALKATHAFYAARDGQRGWLGKRGELRS